jgi:hypothetical protein
MAQMRERKSFFLFFKKEGVSSFDLSFFIMPLA